MFSHVMIGLNDKEVSLPFYDATFAALGIEGEHTENGAFFGSPQTGMFGVTKPRDGEAACHANGGTIGFQAANPAAIDAWYAAGMANGGSDEGAPGLREYGPEPMYGAYMRDPVGNKLCAFTMNVGE